MKLGVASKYMYIGVCCHPYTHVMLVSFELPQRTLGIAGPPQAQREKNAGSQGTSLLLQRRRRKERWGGSGSFTIVLVSWLFLWWGINAAATDEAA